GCRRHCGAYRDFVVERVPFRVDADDQPGDPDLAGRLAVDGWRIPVTLGFADSRWHHQHRADPGVLCVSPAGARAWLDTGRRQRVSFLVARREVGFIMRRRDFLKTSAV